jgi:transposase
MRIQEKVSHVGLDCHRKFSRSTARDRENKILFRQRLEHADRTRLRQQMQLWPSGTHVILEGSFGWSWMTDEIAAAGHVPHLANTRKLDKWRQSRGIAKNNKLDADLISELWPERKPWWEVWLAPVEVRDQRELLRYRMALVHMQSSIKNRIHALLSVHGILHSFSDLFCKAGKKFLQALIEADEPLRPVARQVLKGYLELLEQLRKRIAAVTWQWKQQLRDNDQVRLWKTLPGIGCVLAHTLAAEVGRIDRFAGGRRLARYSLLAPLAEDSGDEDGGTPLGRHVGHAGRHTLKWAFIEAAHGAVRKDPSLRQWWNHYTREGKSNKNRGYIGVANKLARIGYSCVKYNRPYNQQPPPRPGSEAAGSRSAADKPCTMQGESGPSAHPGTGQPCGPMAAGDAGNCV